MITFTRTTQTYNQATGDVVPVVTTVTGSAIQVKGDPQRYQAMGLILATMPTLLFTPTSYGQVPKPGDAVTWSGVDYTVRDVDPLAPDGVVILARVVIGR
jgi:hypothetical protein